VLQKGWRLPKGPRKTILVLEDDPLVMAIFQQVLRSRGFEIYTAASAREALEKFTRNRQKIDVLIADVAIPDSSGLYVALTCCIASPSLRIIVTSGSASSAWTENERRQFEALPADRVALLPKPFSPAQLLDVVDRLTSEAGRNPA